MSNLQKNTILIVFLVFILFSIQIQWFPWWTHIVPIVLAGALASYFNWNIPVFSIGFITGFITWCGMNIYYNQMYSGQLFDKLGRLANINQLIVLLISGIIGGMLTGLALFTGEKLFIHSDRY